MHYNENVKKRFIILILAVLLYLIGPGFIRNGSAFIGDYEVNKETNEISFKAETASSMGFIRCAKTHIEEDTCYVDFYYAFGGLNGKIMAKNEFTINPEDTDYIAVYSSSNGYVIKLEKDTSGNWIRKK